VTRELRYEFVLFFVGLTTNARRLSHDDVARLRTWLDERLPPPG
jgi:hypothetical protein